MLSMILFKESAFWSKEPVHRHCTITLSSSNIVKLQDTPDGAIGLKLTEEKDGMMNGTLESVSWMILDAFVSMSVLHIS